MTKKDLRGCLSVIEDFQLFTIKRVYTIYGASGLRGGHRHKKTIQALVAVHGSCDVVCDQGTGPTRFTLNDPSKALVVQPEDWHTMENFSSDAVLMVLASENYNPEDYIHEPY